MTYIIVMHKFSGVSKTMSPFFMKDDDSAVEKLDNTSYDGYDYIHLYQMREDTSLRFVDSK